MTVVKYGIELVSIRDARHSVCRPEWIYPHLLTRTSSNSTIDLGFGHSLICDRSGGIISPVRVFLALALCVSVSACMGRGYDVLRNELPGSGYSVTKQHLIVNDVPCEIEVYSKFFNSNGKLGACAYLADVKYKGCSGTYFVEELPELWFDQATLVLNGQQVSKAGFYRYRDVKEEALCVEINKPWQPSYEGARPRFKGGFVTRDG